MTSLNTMPQLDLAGRRYQQKRMIHWDGVGEQFQPHSRVGGWYQEQLLHYYRLLVPSGMRVLELGCGNGDLLAALEPSVGVGVDFSDTMIRQASARYPTLRFIQADVHEFWLGEIFDIVILSDLVNDLWDVQAVFEKLSKMIAPHTRVIMNTYSRVWQGPLTWAQRLNISRPNLEQNWLTVEDLTNLLGLTGFECVKQTKEIMLPVNIPFLAPLANHYVVRLWPFSALALANFLVARAAPSPATFARSRGHRVSVVVPARNEAGNIEGVLARTPDMGSSMEFIFVEGHSQDETYEAIQRAMAKYPERQCSVFKQTGKGKGDAVRLGFSK